jgi:hypothetical protein
VYVQGESPKTRAALHARLSNSPVTRGMEMEILGILFFAAILGVIPALIAQGKGRDGFVWWFYGTAVFIIALPHSLMLEPLDGTKTCPFCAEKIKEAATVCRHCHRDQSPPSTQVDRLAGTEQSAVDKDGNQILFIALGAVAAVILPIIITSWARS